jgi:hypothetical protein
MFTISTFFAVVMLLNEKKQVGPGKACFLFAEGSAKAGLSDE